MPDTNEPLGAGIDWADPNSPLAPLYLSSGGVFAVAVVAVAFFFLSTVPLEKTDFWSHLKYGEWVAANRTLPDREPLSPFTDRDARFFDLQWLSQVVYHAAYRAGGSAAGGVELVRVLHAAAGAAALALLGLAYFRASRSSAAAAVGMGVAFVLMPSAFAVQRPQLFALVCFAAVLCALSRETPTRRAVAWVPLVVGLWANLHGSFPVALVLIGAVLIGRPSRRLALLFALSAAATVVNPYGPSIYAGLWQFVGNPNLKTMAEWQALDFAQTKGTVPYLVTLALVAARGIVGRGFTRTQWLLVAAFAAWPVVQQRTFVWWGPLAVWVALPRRDAPPAGLSFRKTALAFLLVAVALVASPATTWLKAGQPRPLDRALVRGTPANLLAVLPPGPVFADEVTGEYLLWALPADSPVALFNHAPLFRPDYWADCVAAKRGGPGWKPLFEKLGVRSVVVSDAHPALAAAVRSDPGWKVLRDDVLFVAVRRSQ